jgi:hypothetical protein
MAEKRLAVVTVRPAGSAGHRIRAAQAGRIVAGLDMMEDQLKDLEQPSKRPALKS